MQKLEDDDDHQPKQPSKQTQKSPRIGKRPVDALAPLTAHAKKKSLEEVLDKLSSAAPEMTEKERERAQKILSAADRLSDSAKPPTQKELEDAEKARRALDKLAAAAVPGSGRKSIPDVLDQLVRVADDLPDEADEKQIKIRSAMDKLAKEGRSSEDIENEKASKFLEPIERLASLDLSSKTAEDEDEDGGKRKKSHGKKKKEKSEKVSSLADDDELIDLPATGIKVAKDEPEERVKLALDKMTAAGTPRKKSAPAKPDERVKKALDKISSKPVRSPERGILDEGESNADGFEQLSPMKTDKVAVKTKSGHQQLESSDSFSGSLFGKGEKPASSTSPDSFSGALFKDGKKPTSQIGPDSLSDVVVAVDGGSAIRRNSASKKAEFLQEDREHELDEKPRLVMDKQQAKREKEKEKQQKAAQEKAEKDKARADKDRAKAEKEKADKAEKEVFRDTKKSTAKKGDHVMLEDD